MEYSDFDRYESNPPTTQNQQNNPAIQGDRDSPQGREVGVPYHIFNFDFASYDFIAQQQNSPATQEIQDPSQRPQAGVTTSEFDIEGFLKLSPEELNALVYSDLTDDQQMTIDASPTDSSTHADEQPSTIQGQADVGTGHRFNGATDDHKVIGEGAYVAIRPPPTQALNEELLPMDNNDSMSGPIPDAEAVFHGQAHSSYHQTFTAPPASAFGFAQAPSVDAEKPRIRMLSEQHPVSVHPMPGDNGQTSALRTHSQRRNPGFQPAPVSRVKKPGRRTAERRRYSVSEFWQMFANIEHPQHHHRCKGTFGELLYRYPELQGIVAMQYANWTRGVASTERKAAPRGKHASKALPQRTALTFDGTNDAANVAQDARVQRSPASLFQIHVDGPVQSPSELNMSGLQVQSPILFGVNSAPAKIVPKITLRNGGAEGFNLEHQSIKAALEYIERPPAEFCERFIIEGDDWEGLADFSAEFKSLCQQLFEALQQPGGDVPEDFDDQQMQNYTRNHGKAYALVLEAMETREQISEAKARVIKAMNEVVRVHQIGIPRAVLQMKCKARGYEVDQESTCKQRAQKVIDNVRACKYIALDVLKSKNLVAFAHAPDQYLLRKWGNSKGNKVRGDNLKDMSALKKGTKTAEEVLGATMRPPGTPNSRVTSAASTLVLEELPQQDGLRSPRRNTMQSFTHLTPHYHGFHGSEHQEDHSPVWYIYQTSDSGTKNGRKRGFSRREDEVEDDLQG